MIEVLVMTEPGNVRLHPELLEKHQKYVKEQLSGKDVPNYPVFLVFHGGSGSAKEEITTAVKNGCVKMNVVCRLLSFACCHAK